MFELGGYALTAILAIAGLTKFRKIIPIIKDLRSLLKKYNEVTEEESARQRDDFSGKTITENEWKILAKEALKLVQDVVSWWSWRSQKR